MISLKASSALLGAALALVACGTPANPGRPAAPATAPMRRRAAVDPAQVERSVARFDAAMARDGGDPRGPTVGPLLDEIAASLAAACLTNELEPKTRSRVIKLLAEARDRRGAPCLVGILERYRPGDDADDIRAAAHAAHVMKLSAASSPLLEIFTTLRASHPNGAAVVREVHDASLALANAAWEPRLLALVERPMSPELSVEARNDEVFWQITAAEALGALGSTKAVPPLIHAVLSREKAEIAPIALTALVHIGKPAVAPAIALLRSDTNETTPAGAERSRRETGALILAAIGREEATPHLLEVMRSADLTTRTFLAGEIVKLPRTPATVKAFQSAYELAPIAPPPRAEGRGREALLAALPQLFDATLTPWIVSTAMEAKGGAADVEAVRGASLIAAMKLMTVDQASVVEKLLRIRIGAPKGKPITLRQVFHRDYQLAAALVTACAAEVACYLKTLSEPTSQALETQFRGVKAATMVGILGGAGDAMRLADQMPALYNATVRLAALLAMDHLAPQGNQEVAQRLEALLEKAGAAAGSERPSGVDPAMKILLYRLLARTQ